MCGIVVVKRKDGKPAYKSVLKRYRAQISRGTLGFGYVAIQDNRVVSYKRAETEREIVNLISKEKASEIWFHHRQPTGTPNMTELAHPFLIENPLFEHQYFVGHNGVIRNTGDLKEAHEKLGIEYTSEMLKAFVTKNGEQHITGVAWNDSESLAIETALALDGKKNRIETEGPAAVIGLQTKGHKVVNRFFFRNNLNPLKWHEDKVMVTITSAGEGTVVEPEKVFALNQSGSGFHELMEGKLLPFLSYKPTAYEGRSKTGGHWKDGKWVIRDEENTTMGYLRSGLSSVGDILGLPPMPRDDIPFGPENDEPSNTKLTWETKDLISQLSVSELWNEHDILVRKERDLKGELANIDSRVSYTVEILSKREELQNQLDENQTWMDAVMDEIVDRSSQDDISADMPLSQDDIDDRMMK